MKTFNKALIVCVALCSILSDGMTFASDRGNLFMKEIKLSPSVHGQFYAQVDDSNFDELNKHRWYPIKDHNTFYAVRMKRENGTFKMYIMHRVIMGAKDGEIVDHQDRNGLNNQEYNLRKCTHSQNMANRKSAKNSSSKYLGVTWNKALRKWKATVQDKYLGYYAVEEDAARAYDEKAKELFGEFANLNFK